MHKCLREKLLPLHSMHCSNFSDRIDVKKTPEQCSLNHYSSQRARKDVWWDMYSSEGLNDWQVCDQDGLKENYIMKKTPMRGGSKKNWKEWEKKITVASTFISSEFNNNSSPRTTIFSSFISVSILVYSGNPY